MNNVFSVSSLASGGNGLVGRLRRFRDSLVGGSDIVVFFDFMSLLQIGRSESSELIPCTAEEDMMYQDCLPNMGLLYSMFAVLVLDQVVPAVAPYHASGWCFSEVHTALLGGQLERFSPHYENDIATSFLFSRRGKHPGPNFSIP